MKAPCAAIVSVPDALHFEITANLIKKGIHVQVVKPLVPTKEENQALIRLKNKHQILGCVEYHKRYDQANLKLYDLIRKGALGDLLHFRINYSQRKTIPRNMFKGSVETTNIFQYLGVHYVDLIYFLTHAVPVRVMSMGMKKYLLDQGINTYDTIQTLVEWNHGQGRFLSSHLTGWIDPDISTAMSDQRLEVIGTKGRYRSDQKNRGVTFVADDHGYEEINPYFSQFYPDQEGDFMQIQGYGPKSILQFITDAVDIVHNRKDVERLNQIRPSFESSMVVSGVLEASEKSLAENNIWIKI
ncbi:MAG: Gfo/Idh/MocA family oxidoreductase [Desulfobacter sp.]|nr:Gfo/Idh/MocA family oxidoreductase [Desulfobacter sp.]